MMTIRTGATLQEELVQKAPQLSSIHQSLLERMNLTPLNDADLQYLGITKPQLNHLGTVRDKSALERELAQVLTQAVQGGARFSLGLKKADTREQTKNQVKQMLVRLLMQVKRQNPSVQIGIPQVVAGRILGSIESEIPGMKQEQETESHKLISVRPLSAEDLALMKIRQTDIGASTTMEESDKAIQQLFLARRPDLKTIKDEAAYKTEKEFQTKIRQMTVEEKAGLIFQYLAAIRNAKIEAAPDGRLSVEDVKWLRKNEADLRERAKLLASKKEQRPGVYMPGMEETAYGDLRSLVDDIQKIKNYQTLMTGKLEAPTGDERKDQSARKDYEQTLVARKSLSDEIDRVSTIEVGGPDKAIVDRLIEELDKVTTDPQKRELVVQFISPELEGSHGTQELNERIRRIDDRIKEYQRDIQFLLAGRDIKITLTGGDLLTSDERSELEDQVKSPDPTIKRQALERMIKILKARREEIKGLEGLMARGKLDQFSRYVDIFYKGLQRSKQEIKEKTTAPQWQKFINVLGALSSSLNRFFTHTDVKNMVAATWDKGADPTHQTTIKGSDPKYKNVLDEHRAQLDKMTGDDPVREMFEFITSSKLLDYISAKLDSYFEDKFYEGPTFDQTVEAVEELCKVLDNFKTRHDPKGLFQRLSKKLTDQSDLRDTIERELKAREAKRETKKESKPPKAKKTEAPAPAAPVAPAAAPSAEKEAAVPKDVTRSLKQTTRGKAEWGRWQELPHKVKGKVQLPGFIGEPTKAREFLRTLNKHSSLILDSFMRGLNKEEVDKKMRKDFDIDKTLVEILGIEAKNLDKRLTGEYFNHMMELRLGDKSDLFKIVHDKELGIERPKHEMVEDKIVKKMGEVKSKYLPTLNTMAKFMIDPKPFVEQSIKSAPKGEQEQLMEALKRVKSISPEEKEDIERERHDEQEALKAMKEKTFTKKNILPILEGWVKKNPISDVEYNAIVKEYHKDPTVEEIVKQFFSLESIKAGYAHRRKMTDIVKQVLDKDPVELGMDDAKYKKMIEVHERQLNDTRQILEKKQVLITEADRATRAELLSKKKSGEELTDQEQDELERIQSVDSVLGMLSKDIQELRSAIDTIKSEHEGLQAEVPGRIEQIREEALRLSRIPLPKYTPMSPAQIDKMSPEDLLAREVELRGLVKALGGYGRTEGGLVQQVMGYQIRLNQKGKWIPEPEFDKLQRILTQRISDLQSIIKNIIKEMLYLSKKTQDKREMLKMQDEAKKLEEKLEKKKSVTHAPAPAPAPAPGMIKMAAVDPYKSRNPEDILRETAQSPEERYEDEDFALNDFDLARLLIKHLKSEQIRLHGLDKDTGKMVKEKVTEINKKLMISLGKLADLKVKFGRMNVPVKEVSAEFNKLLDEYLSEISKLRAQRAELKDRTAKSIRDIAEIEKYRKTNPETHETYFEMAPDELRSMKDLFYTSLYWSLMQAWSSKPGYSNVFGERDQISFKKLTDAFMNFGDVKTSPLYQKMLRSAKSILQSDYGSKHAKKKVQLTHELKAVESKLKAMKLNPDDYDFVRKLKADIVYLSRVNEDKKKIMRMIGEKIDESNKINILNQLYNKTSDERLKAECKRQIETLGGKVNQEIEEKSKDLVEEVPPDLDVAFDKDVQVAHEQVVQMLTPSGKVPGMAEVLEEKPLPSMKAPAPKTPKQAYDTTHPDFDLKWLYHPLMQKKIAELAIASL